MPSIQLICQKSELKNRFKEKFKSAYNIFTSESVKDGLRNVQKMDIDLLIIEVQPNRLKSYSWMDSLLRQKNITNGEMCIIFLMDPEYIQNPSFQRLLSYKKNFHFFWLNSGIFTEAETLFTALEIFMKNILADLNTMRMNYILSNRLTMLNQVPLSDQSLNHDSKSDYNQPLSFLPHNNTNLAFIENIQKTIRQWPTVILRGPEGLEQENIAKYIHSKNNYQNQFISVDLSEIPEFYHDSILFGLKQKNLPGFKYINNSLFETVKKGTLYIKNIEYLKWEVQNDLFRLLQNLYYYREEIKVNVKCKMIFSSSVDLEKYVEKGLLRQDLYSHLAVYTLNIPSIVQRKKDIPLIIDDYINWFEKKYSKKIEMGTEVRLQIMKNHYPGQFDQLYTYLYKIFSLSDGNITPATLSLLENNGLTNPENNYSTANNKADSMGAPRMQTNPVKKQSRFLREKEQDSTQFLFTDLDESKNLDYSLTEVEREYIKHVLAQNYNNIAETARILGITRKTLYGKLKKYRINNPVKKSG